MKLLMTADTVGGVWTYAIELIRGLREHDVDVVLATMGQLPTEDQQRQARKLDNLTLLSSTFRLEWMQEPWRDVDAAGQWLLELEREYRPDVVHLNGYAHAACPWLSPRVVVAHSCVLSWWQAVHGEAAPVEWDEYRRRVSDGLRQADAVIAPTATMLQWLHQHYGPFEDSRRPRLQVIYNGRSPTRYTPGPKHPFILGAGRLWDQAKNLAALDAAAADLPWRVYLAGSVQDPDTGRTIQARHARLLEQLDDEQIRRWLCEADIYAAPSRYEPFGLSILEAALCGCTLVLGDIPSLRELWGDAAVFVPPTDHAALHEALSTLIKSPHERRTLADAARQRALQFTPQQMARQYLHCYQALVDDARLTAAPVNGHARHAPATNGSHAPEADSPSQLQMSGHASDASPAIDAAQRRAHDRPDESHQATVVRLLAHSDAAVSNHDRDALTSNPARSKLRIVMFYHSLISDWNHGNAHFLRGMVAELKARGHDVLVYEPQNGWSLQNLLQHYGQEAIYEFHNAFPHLHSTFYDPETIDLDLALDGADLVIAHEWNDPKLIRRLSEHRKSAAGARGGYRLLFHDTHHRAVTNPQAMSQFDLSGFDGALVFGSILRDIYLQRGWTQRVWVWHEAADVRTYWPRPVERKLGDVVWIGNWGDEERTAELTRFLLEPIRSLQLTAKVYGVRYPAHVIDALHAAGIEYGNWVASADVPRTLARYRFTVHVPRRPYVEQLPGIPTIRVFEALACGIPLICSPWQDSEHLFTPGEDFLIANDTRHMQQHMRDLLHDQQMADALAARGRQTILNRHTCAHRADELLSIVSQLRQNTTSTSDTAITASTGVNIMVKRNGNGHGQRASHAARSADPRLEPDHRPVSAQQARWPEAARPASDNPIESASRARQGAMNGSRLDRSGSPARKSARRAATRRTAHASRPASPPTSSGDSHV